MLKYSHTVSIISVYVMFTILLYSDAEYFVKATTKCFLLLLFHCSVPAFNTEKNVGAPIFQAKAVINLKLTRDNLCSGV